MKRSWAATCPYEAAQAAAIRKTQGAMLRASREGLQRMISSKVAL